MQRAPQIAIFQHNKSMPKHMPEGCYIHSDNIRIGTMWDGDKDRYIVRIDLFQDIEETDQ